MDGVSHKRIPGSNFVVDDFKVAPKSGQDWTYFLSHFHSDHYDGLTHNWCKGVVYCSPITAHLLTEIHGVPAQFVCPLALDTQHPIAGATVTLIDANHCPGAVQFVFVVNTSGLSKTYLHCGDARFCQKFYTNATLLSIRHHIEAAFLDTTYCNPRHSFPLQEVCVDYVVEHALAALQSPRRTVILISTYVIGKERILVAVAKALGMKIWAPDRKLAVLRVALSSEDMQYFTDDIHSTHVHVTGWGFCGDTWPFFRPNFVNLENYCVEHSYERVVAFVPTGWTYESKKKTFSTREKGQCVIHLVPYSEHSSFTELREYVKFLRPARIIPTVNTTDAAAVQRMVAHLTDLVDHTQGKRAFFSAHFASDSPKTPSFASHSSPPPADSAILTPHSSSTPAVCENDRSLGVTREMLQRAATDVVAQDECAAENTGTQAVRDSHMAQGDSDQDDYLPRNSVTHTVCHSDVAHCDSGSDAVLFNATHCTLPLVGPGAPCGRVETMASSSSTTPGPLTEAALGVQGSPVCGAMSEVFALDGKSGCMLTANYPANSGTPTADVCVHSNDESSLHTDGSLDAGRKQDRAERVEQLSCILDVGQQEAAKLLEKHDWDVTASISAFYDHSNQPSSEENSDLQFAKQLQKEEDEAYTLNPTQTAKRPPSPPSSPLPPPKRLTTPKKPSAMSSPGTQRSLHHFLSSSLSQSPTPSRVPPLSSSASLSHASISAPISASHSTTSARLSPQNKTNTAPRSLLPSSPIVATTSLSSTPEHLSPQPKTITATRSLTFAGHTNEHAFTGDDPAKLRLHIGAASHGWSDTGPTSSACVPSTHVDTRRSSDAGVANTSASALSIHAEPRPGSDADAANTTRVTTRVSVRDGFPEGSRVSKSIWAFDPEEDACWTRGCPVPYAHLAHCFAAVESTKARLKIVDLLTNLFRSIIWLSPQSLLAAVYLCTEGIAPAYEAISLGIGGGVVSDAVMTTMGASKATMRSLYNELGDLGDVTLAVSKKCTRLITPSGLSVSQLFDALHELSRMGGSGSLAAKRQKIQSLLVKTKGVESKFLVRTLIGQLRIGVQPKTLLTALARACVLSPHAPPPHIPAIHARGEGSSARESTFGASSRAELTGDGCAVAETAVTPVLGQRAASSGERHTHVPLVGVDGSSDGSSEDDLVVLDDSRTSVLSCSHYMVVDDAGSADSPTRSTATNAKHTDMHTSTHAVGLAKEHHHAASASRAARHTSSTRTTSGSGYTAASPSTSTVASSQCARQTAPCLQAAGHTLTPTSTTSDSAHTAVSLSSRTRSTSALTDADSRSSVHTAVLSPHVSVDHTSEKESGSHHIGIHNAGRRQSDTSGPPKIVVGSKTKRDAHHQPGVNSVGKTKSDRRMPEQTAMEQRMSLAVEELKKAYVEHPNFSDIVPLLLDGKIMTLSRFLHLCPGVPMKPMLGTITKSYSDVLLRCKDTGFSCEFKYDGQRAQIHRDANGGVTLFSRHLEPLTAQYPDVVRLFSSPDWPSFVLDAELVAVDSSKNATTASDELRLLPFQTLSTRAKKNVSEANITVTVCVFAFDLLYLKGNSFLHHTFTERRGALHSHFHERWSQFHFVQDLLIPPFSVDVKAESSEDVISTFMEQAWAGGCEGLMVKQLSGPASVYQPAERSMAWLKLKRDYLDGLGDSLDLVPIGAWHGSGRKAGWYSPYLMACYNEEDETLECLCKVMTGFTDVQFGQFTSYYNGTPEQHGGHIIDGPKWYYRVPPQLTPDVWLDGSEVWEIKGAELTISPLHLAAHGIVSERQGLSLRFPRFLRQRPDKVAPAEATTSVMLANAYHQQHRNVVCVPKQEEEADSS